MQPRELQRSLKKWQTLLGLDHWIITARYVPPWKVDEDCTARAQVDTFHQKATIEIIEGRFQDPNDPSYESTLHLLVHELLHCLLPDAVKESDQNYVLFEQGINRLARVLIDQHE